MTSQAGRRGLHLVEGGGVITIIISYKRTMEYVSVRNRIVYHRSESESGHSLNPNCLTRPVLFARLQDHRSTFCLAVGVNMECREEVIYKIAGYDFDWRRVGQRLLSDQKTRDIDREGGSSQRCHHCTDLQRSDEE